MNAMTETTAQLETFAAEAQKSLTESMEKIAKSFEDVATFNQASLDAFMKSANTSVKSAEEINGEMMSYSKKSIEESMAAAKDFAASKSVMELVEKQNDFAKTYFDGYMKQMTKVNEMAMAAAKEALEPISGRVTAMKELMKV